MRKEKVISNYGLWSDYELSTLAGRVLKAMQEANTTANFPTPNPGLDVLETLVNTYIAHHEIASRRGSALEISQKNESREALLVGLRNLAHYVNEIANGQLSMLLSTGLVLVAQPSSSQLPLVPQRLRLRDGRISGMVHIDMAPVKGAWDYEIAIGDSVNEQGEIQWNQTLMTTSSRGNFVMDLTPGTQYYVRVRARNGKGTGDWSEPVSLIAR
jgi:hypothetical protein